jgi:hypothetical protein
MIARMRFVLAAALLTCFWQCAHAQCAPAPDSAYFFRDLSEERAEAKIAENRKFYDNLLSESFTARVADGKPLSRAEYITAELSDDDHAASSHRFFSISNYTLVEHVQGHTVATYLLREVGTSAGKTRILESQLRETYEVQDGRWRLMAVEVTPAGSSEGVSASR